MAELKIDNFKDEFKYFKRKSPAPDLSSVVELNVKVSRKVAHPFALHAPSIAPVAGLREVETWQAFELPSNPGFILIRNPFKPGFQRYWVERCLQDYHQHPNVTNLDNLKLKPPGDVWEEAIKEGLDEKNKSQLGLWKLRWATLGYHYDWTAKLYYEESHADFPEDLDYLARYIASAVGYNHYRPEAGIVNYYHMDSTLSGHTDHSEFDLEAPLISISFGQRAIFLIGGTTREIRPVPVFLHSGDIAVMSGKSRLAYHAVPRVLAEEQRYLDKCLSYPNLCDDNPTETHLSCESNSHTQPKGLPVNKQCDKDLQTSECPCPKKKLCTRKCEAILTNAHSCSDVLCRVNQKIYDYISNCDWAPFQQYLNNARINVNIRQVLKPGQDFPQEADCVESVNTSHEKSVLDDMG